MNVGIRSACYLCGKPVSIYFTIPNARCMSCGKPFCMNHGVNFVCQPCLSRLPEHEQKIVKKLARNGNPGYSSACCLLGCPVVLSFILLFLFGAYTKGDTFAIGIVVSAVICLGGTLGGRQIRLSSVASTMKKIKTILVKNASAGMTLPAKQAIPSPCPRCKGTVFRGVCSSCGSRVCMTCGALVDEADSKFCGYCGHLL